MCNIYLIQGKLKNVINSLQIIPNNSEIICLTYDYECFEFYGQNIIFIYKPKTTWAEGRNILLEYVLSKKYQFEYLIFLDDDVFFANGSFSVFESLLKKYKPLIAIPLTNVILESNRYNKKLIIQHPIGMDQIVQAYNKEVINENIILPYITKFDNLSWWYSCEINTHLILSKYRGKVLQFNNIIIFNKHHGFDQNFQTVDQNSLYKGGIDYKYYPEIKEYIELKFGQQPKIQNLLFHDFKYPFKLYFKSIFEHLNFIYSNIKNPKYIYKFYFLKYPNNLVLKHTDHLNYNSFE
jgi:hypothetical protein